MKKIFLSFLCAMLFAGWQNVAAQSFEVDGIFYNISSSIAKTVAVTSSGDKYTGNVVIPESVTYNDVTYSVTSIGGEAFYGCTGLTSITIPNSVTSIGNSAFRNCSGLKSIEIPGSVTSIGSYAFGGCTGLASIEIPNGVTSIISYAFQNCSGLASIEIPNSVTSIGYSAFEFCTGLTSITIPNSVTSIGSNAFHGCTGLTSITIPNSVTSIGSNAFSGCDRLTSIEIPNSVTSIGQYAFSGCTGLKEVHISDLAAWCNIKFDSSTANPLYCAHNLYLNGELVTDLVIPDGISEIKNSAFSGCSGLASIEIPNSVTSIGYSAFEFCTGLTSITIPNSVTSIGSNAFHGCTGLTSITIPNSVTSIGNDAFSGCDGLTSIEIPNSVTSIGQYAFSGCTGLASVTIPASVTSIGQYAFSGVIGVFELAAEIPATLGTSAFTGGAVIVVPDEAYEAYCNASVWSDYKSLMTVESAYTKDIEVSHESNFSSVLSAIGEENTTKVVNLTIKGSINSYDVIVLRDKMPLLRHLDLSQATVAASSKAFYEGNCTAENDLGSRAFYNLSNLMSVKLPMGLVKISDNLFYGCGKLVAVGVPSTVQSVGNSAFYNCSSLKEISLPETMSSIGSCAFYNCSSLKSIVIPKGIIALPSYHYYGLFEGCRNLESVTLPDGLETIGQCTFDGCSNLKSIKLPPTLTTIEEYAFSSCSSLEEIRIPSSVTSISNNAFAGCNNLNKVYTYTVEPTSISENTFSTFTTATLYVPKVSYWNYYWDDGWKRFLNLADFDEPYEYFYVNNDYTLDDKTGYIEGADGKDPDADINAGGGLIVEGEQSDEEEPNQSLGDVNVNHDGKGNGATIIGDNNLHVDNLHIRINVKGGRWYFFAFPFDIPFEKISMENGSDYIFRYYDGDERAKGNSGWKDINENHLKAARGYIFQCSANDVLVLSIEDIRFKKEDKYNELVAHVSENLKDASWNFMGNPYLSYYDMADMDYTAPVTVWDGSKYVAMRPGDDDYHFGPYEAFFVQKPGDKENVGFNGDDKMTGKQSKEKKEKQAAARRARGVDPDRLLINITIAHNDESDRTRVVFNERQTSNYETACDAAKFSTSGVTQLYTIDNEGVHYAINERPVGNGVVAIGYTAVENGTYTIEAPRMDVPVYLVDKKNGTVHDFKDGEYSFTTEAGTYEDRFEISLAKDTTGIEGVENESDEDAEVYDLHGRRIKSAGNGVYIINGEKILVK